MKSVIAKILPEDRQKSERSAIPHYADRPTSLDRELKSQDEDEAAVVASEKLKAALAKLANLIRENPGISKDEIVRFGGYQSYPAKEMDILKRTKAIQWRKRGYFPSQSNPV